VWYKEISMELRLTRPQLIQVDNYFINLDNLLWAEIKDVDMQTGKKVVILVYGFGANNQQLTLPVYSELLIAFLKDASFEIR
jgi:hypothetical protein